MPAWLVTGILVSVIAFILWAPVERALVAFLAVVILVPPAMVLPNALSSGLTAPRLVTVALALRVLIAIRRREVSTDVLRPTPVHCAFYAFLLVAVVNGVLLAAPATSTTDAVSRWLDIVDQFVVFAVVLAVVRSLGDTRPLARAFVILVGISAAIAIGERITGSSWSRLFLEHLPGQSNSIGAGPLETRSGNVRVRAGAGYALTFGWIGAMALPLATVIAVRSRSWLVRAIPIALVLAVYWTNSRSAVGGLAITVLVVAIFGGDRRVLALALAGVVVGGLIWLGAPSVRGPFSGTSQSDSSQIRQQRVPEITHLLLAEPYHGVGLQGLIPLGFPSTDASYLLLYAELGVIGLASFAALLIVLFGSCAPRLRGPPSPERVLGAAAFAGLVGGVLAGVTFDHFQQMGSALLFWILAAIAVQMGERRAAPGPAVTASGRRLALVPLVVVVGLILRGVVPSHASVETSFDAVPTARTALSPSDEIFISGILRKTACDVAHVVPLPPSTNLSCVLPGSALGYGTLRVDAPTRSTAERAMDSIVATLEEHPSGVSTYPRTPEVGVPTWARTAPVWAPTAALLIGLFWPATARRRRQAPGTPDPALTGHVQDAAEPRVSEG